MPFILIGFQSSASIQNRAVLEKALRKVSDQAFIEGASSNPNRCQSRVSDNTCKTCSPNRPGQKGGTTITISSTVSGGVESSGRLNDGGVTSPKGKEYATYEQVPEVSFLRTYVCEDMTKCLCLYNAPHIESVVKD